MNYEIQAHREIGKRGSCQVFYVNGVRAGTSVAHVKNLVQAPNKVVSMACAEAKWNGGESIFLTVGIMEEMSRTAFAKTEG